MCHLFKYQSSNELVQTIYRCIDCRDNDSCDIYAGGATAGDHRYKIPDRCPKLLKQLDYVALCLRHHPEVQRMFKTIMDEPCLYDHALAHADVVATVGSQFLDACKSTSFRKDLCLLRIAALLHELGRAEDAKHDSTFASARIAEWLLSQTIGLNLTDKLTVIDAILFQHELERVKMSGLPVIAALFFGDKLSFGRMSFKSKIPKNISGLSDFDKQAYSIKRVSFKVHKQPRPTGILTITYDQRDAFLMGFGDEFCPEAFSDCPELIVEPYEVAKQFLGIEDFRIRVLSSSLRYPGEHEEFNFSIEDFKFL